jgi:hypothetical protein
VLVRNRPYPRIVIPFQKVEYTIICIFGMVFVEFGIAVVKRPSSLYSKRTKSFWPKTVRMGMGKRPTKLPFASYTSAAPRNWRNVFRTPRGFRRERVDRGVKEITLLGQIVTSYGRGEIPRRDGKSAFVQLLDAVNEVEGLERIRFTAPHPKGYGDDLVEAYARLPKLVESAHIPVQSGSDRVLKLMHRGYTRERFLEINLNASHNITTGRVYKNVIEKERRGDFLGTTVQIIPHITDEIKASIARAAGIPVDSRPAEICLVEVGGTVGDIESMPFLEAIRQMRGELPPHDMALIHVTLVPIDTMGELKTKPTQHSVKALREVGLQPDIIVARSVRPTDWNTKKKISSFCDVRPEAVISAATVPDVYEVPLELEREGLADILCDRLGLEKAAKDGNTDIREELLTIAIERFCNDMHFLREMYRLKLDQRDAGGLESLHDIEGLPHDLCGEIELWLGDEKHILTKSCMVFIPKGLKHCPLVFRRVDRPIFHFSAGPARAYDRKYK